MKVQLLWRALFPDQRKNVFITEYEHRTDVHLRVYLADIYVSNMQTASQTVIGEYEVQDFSTLQQGQRPRVVPLVRFLSTSVFVILAFGRVNWAFKRKPETNTVSRRKELLTFKNFYLLSSSSYERLMIGWIHIRLFLFISCTCSLSHHSIFLYSL